MDTMQKIINDDAHWAVRAVPAGAASGYVGEVYNELAMSFETTDSSLDPIDGAWLRAHIYRSLTTYATAEQACEAGERLRQFLDIVHLRE